MAIIAGLSDNNSSYNAVKMTQKSCFLMVSMGYFWCYFITLCGVSTYKEVYVQLYKVSKGMNQLFMDVYWVRWTKCERANKKELCFHDSLGGGKMKL